MDTYFVTTNENKFIDLYKRFGKHNLVLKQAKIDLNEGRFDTVEETLQFKLLQAKTLLPNYKIIVDDRGLFINGLNGFPGPYIKYTLKKIGFKGIVKLLEGLPRNLRQADFVFTLAYYDGDKDIIFSDIEKGCISDIPSSSNQTWEGLLNIFINPDFSDGPLSDLDEQKFALYLK